MRAHRDREPNFDGFSPKRRCTRLRAVFVATAIGLALGAGGPAFAQLRGGGPSFSVGPRGPSGPSNLGGSFGYPGGSNYGWSTGGSPGPLPPSVANYPPPPSTNANRVRSSRTRSNNNGIPPAGEGRYVPDEVVIQLNGNPSPRVIDALARRHRLTRMESQNFSLLNGTLYRWHITNGRSVPAVIADLAADRGIAWAQPNYLYSLQENAAQDGTVSKQEEGDASQYAIAKLHLSEAHSLAKGDNVVVAVIDSGVDLSHPELQGIVVDQFDALGATIAGDRHGTAIAGIIAAHGRLIGAAPAVHMLAARVFAVSSSGTTGTTFNIIKGLDWAMSRGARVINMSFAGPADPLLQRATASARQKGAIMIAAAGNAGPKSQPLYPAADPSVIAVTATDAEDHLFSMANRGDYVAAAAPGVDILIAAPGDSYQISSGTSYAAAYASGVAALILERRPTLQPDAIKRILVTTAHSLGPKEHDDRFGAGLIDAYRAVLSLEPNAATTVPAVR
jgi:subtilisin family serine protease